eukprot:TRINITY_DN14778_c0_g1_i1.p1 TRINITY_DN14778_c0_g1~~TRINITY_DN14778_c0_g1_i1.p1  ORF type:complete len:586 (+),score=165.36 TRINITY_DN14778_c0_g1_i1:20-1777(+)
MQHSTHTRVISCSSVWWRFSGGLHRPESDGIPPDTHTWHNHASTSGATPDTTMTTSSETTMVASNRCNIPAICRIPGRGTGFLVGPGLIMTSLHVVRNKPEAAKLQAIFFESGKQSPVAVDLKPYRTFFVSAFPEHLSYALVACDTRGIRSVIPVKLPLVEGEWADVEEGDMCMVVQHPLPSTAGDTPELVEDDDDESALNPANQPDLGIGPEVKQFMEVLSRRDDIMAFKVNHKFNAAGCPLFNAKGELAGLQSQLVRSGQGGETTSYAVHIREIVRHLFANGKLSLFEASNTPQELWRTWRSERDVVRTLRIVQNFQHTEIVQTAMRELCSYSGDEEKMQEIMDNDGTRIIIENLQRYRMDDAVVRSSFRTLWNLSFGDDSRRKEIVSQGGIPNIIQGMEKFGSDEEITEYGCVLLYNLSSLPEHVTEPLCEKGTPVVMKATELYPKSEVVIKFTLGVLMNIARSTKEHKYVAKIVDLGGLEMACRALTECVRNEYLVENSVLLIAAVASHLPFARHPALAACVVPLIGVLKTYSANKTMARDGNRALWYLGLEPSLRVVIIRNQGLEVLDATIDAVAQTLGT